VFWKRAIRPALVCAALAALSGCASHYAAGYSTYDPYYYDYHPWSGPEPGYYNEWLLYSHRPQTEYRRLRRDDQRQYWQWRHEHHPEPGGRPGRDHRRR